MPAVFNDCRPFSFRLLRQESAQGRKKDLHIPLRVFPVNIIRAFGQIGPERFAAARRKIMFFQNGRQFPR